MIKSIVHCCVPIRPVIAVVFSFSKPSVTSFGHRTSSSRSFSLPSSIPISASSSAISSLSPYKMEPGWTSLGTPSIELRLEHTLPTGQTFRWKETAPGEFTGVLGGRVLILRQLDDDVTYCVLSRVPGASPEEDTAAIAEYFNLSVNLSSLAEKWKAADPHFAKLSDALPGARMLRQDPVECLFSFICSQNNHISRIGAMVNKLASLYGTPFPLESETETKLYAFPTLEQLSKATEDELRDAGFGYRARYIVAAVEELSAKPEGGVAWLKNLRSVSFQEAVDELCTLSGVGPKVAACAALFSLDKHGAVPVDVHVWNLATKRYCPQLRGKTNTPKLHPVVQDAFTKLFGPYAGWAHNTLFISELAIMKEKVAAVLSEDEDASSLVDDSDVSESESESEEDYTVVAATSAKRKIKQEDGGDAELQVPTPLVDGGAMRKRRKAAVKAEKKTQSQLKAVEVKIE